MLISYLRHIDLFASTVISLSEAYIRLQFCKRKGSIIFYSIQPYSIGQKKMKMSRCRIRRILMMAILFFLCIQVRLIFSQFCGSDEILLNGFCCMQCLPGQGVTATCIDSSSNTVCQPCVPGESYSTVTSHRAPCRLCSACPDGSTVAQPCTPSSDTICRCAAGMYFDSITRSCRNCDLCQAGFGVKRACGPTANTVCERCSNGSYSDVRSDESCVKCSVCDVMQITLQICTSDTDTLCVDIPDEISDGFEHDDVTIGHVTQDGGSTSALIPIFCSLLGLVILVVLIWVIIRIRRQKIGSKVQGNGHRSNGGSPVKMNSPPRSWKKDDESLRNGMSFEASPSKASISDNTCSEPLLVTNMTRFQDVPDERKDQFETLLLSSPSPESTILHLATALGSSAADMEQRRNRQITGATYLEQQRTLLRLFLNDWSCLEMATVGQLAEALTNIGRADCINVLYFNLSSHNNRYMNEYETIS